MHTNNSRAAAMTPALIGLPLKWMNFAKTTVDNNQQPHKENE